MALRSNRREFFSALAGGAVGLSISFKAFGQNPPIKATKLSDRIAVMMGDGGNVGVILGDDGIMMIDGGLPNRADEMLGAIREQVDAHPVKLLFDTHWHTDHVGCNETLGRQGVKIMAHENVKKRLSVRTTMESMNRTFDPLKPEGLPTQEFSKGGRMTFGKEKIEYQHIATSHTDGDTYLFFPGPNILHTGDMLFNGFYPVIDYSTLGWVGGMAHAAQTMVKLCDAKTKVIPGHGPIGSREDLRATAEMLATVTERLQKLIKEGKSADEAVAAAPTKDFDAKYGHGAFKPDAWTRIAYTSIGRHTQKA
ncbi:MAG TPA: MBL fold metallo-hydrolase [Bryobacteraceae bacterium]|nr:MBL fold metallo-hydrolase [Bryobacteraceae bacterium]